MNQDTVLNCAAMAVPVLLFTRTTQVLFGADTGIAVGVVMVALVLVLVLMLVLVVVVVVVAAMVLLAHLISVHIS